MAHDVADFRADVIEESRSIPVLVDFWAAWCGPCQVLGPVLEKLAGEAGGRWKLAKLDVDKNQQVAAEYRIQGIPAVKLFQDGEVIAQFTGALPEQQVRSWLDENIPNESRKALDRAKQLLEGPNPDEAVPVLESLIESDPLPEAQVLLARRLVFQDPDRAIALIEAVPDPQIFDAVLDVRELTGAFKANPGALPEGPLKNNYVEGIQSLKKQDFDTALQKLIEVMMVDKSYDNDTARKLCIAVFRYLGEQHEISQRHRPRFNMSLS